MPPRYKTRILPALRLLELEPRLTPAFAEFLDPNSVNGNAFGFNTVPLANGNVVITSSNDDAGGFNVGAVYLYSGSTGKLLSTLRGSTANDTVGSGGIIALPSGNFLVRSPNWDSPTGQADVGAVTFVNGLTGLTGAVSSSNSLVGSTASDAVGSSGITVLTNGNYLVRSNNYDFLSAVNSGALTWGSGTKGVSGVVSAANSLVSTMANVAGSVVTELANGNYLARTSAWDNGAATDAGAITWGSGTAGVSGIISAANSLVGASAGDVVGSGTPTLLPNGDYIVATTTWDNGAAGNAGAVTLCDGDTGRTGTVSAANSLVGSTANDSVGNIVTLLPGGNFLVSSGTWDNGAAVNAGAVTFVNGVTGLVGAVSAANSLVGSASSDGVGSNAPVVLANGNYVVRSPLCDNGAINGAGAVTWANGAVGVSGPVTAANSFVGGTASDNVGAAVTTLPNGNYVIVSSAATISGVATAGAVTWCNGLTGRVGAVSNANSLVGPAVGDQAGSSGIVILANSNFVVRSPAWNNGAISNAGAATWVNGTTGLTGSISAANSLVGTTADDSIGLGTITPLANGNYVVATTLWDNGVLVDVGHVTWCNGTTGVSGAVSLSNSLIGSTANDTIGITIVPLPGGNYVVCSNLWDNGAAANAGAVTWGSGTAGVSGQITAANSLIGTTAGDALSNGGVTVLANGNYVVASTGWTNGAAANAGAATWGSGSAGVSGAVSASNSLVGTTAGDAVGSNVIALPNGHYITSTTLFDLAGIADVGAVIWGNGNSGISGSITAANSLVGGTAGDKIGNSGVSSLGNGHYLVRSSIWDNGAITSAGAVTWGNGTSGTAGVVSAANSLVGSTVNDLVGNNVTILADGDYLVASNFWNYAALVDSGAMTWGSGSGGLTGPVSPANSIVGVSGTTTLNATPVIDDVNDTFFARFTIEFPGGHVRVGSQSSGVIPTLDTVYVDDGFAAFAGSSIPDADPGTPGSQPALVGENAFGTIAEALARLKDGGKLVLNPGTYADSVAMTRESEWFAATGVVNVSGAISGPFGLKKTGTGILALTGVNSFTGDIQIDRGQLQFNADTALGDAANTVSLSSLGTLNAIAGVNIGRAVALNGGTFFVGTASILNGAVISGGLINAPGGITTATSGVAFTNVNTTTGSVITLGTASDSLDTFSNAGALTVAGVFTASLSLTNEPTGSITVQAGSQLSGVGFSSLGQMTVSGKFSSSSIASVFAAGSVTTVNSSGIVNMNSDGIRVAGGLVKNSGTFGGGGVGTVTVDYNGRVQGSGTFGSVVTQNGGVFAPGSSPGTATTNQLNLNGGGRLEFEVTDASGTPGVVSGWDLVNVQPTSFSPTGLMNYTSTPSDKYIIQLKSRLDDGIGNTPGNIDNFNGALSYAWKFADGSNLITSSSGSFNAGNFQIDTSGFTNSFSGGFGVELRDGGKNLYVVYTPVAGPMVTGIVVNDANTQRSRLTKVQVNFASPVDAATLQTPGAVTFTRTAATTAGTIGTIVNTSNGLIVSPGIGLVSSITLTFQNITNAGVNFGSLADGRWQLAIPSAAYTSTAGDTILRRLFGDVDNNGTVDATDLSFFPPFGAAAASPFDFNNNGDIDSGTDLSEFGNRFGLTL